jgi:hypothetical protein
MFTAFFSTIAAELPDNLKERQEELSEKLKILDVEDDDFEDESDNEFFVLKIRSSQDPQSTDLSPIMRVTVKLFDKKTQTTVFAQEELKSKRLPGDDKYSGTTRWEFHIPYKRMKKPRLVAHAVEFGVFEGDTFIPASVDYDDVESAEEILAGRYRKVKISKSTCKHDK